jgi:hypothetical protein
MKKDLRYLHLASGDDLPVLSGLGAFKALLVIEGDVHQPWQWDASRWLVESGCRYMMAWGSECATWAEAVDDASLEAANYEDVPEEQTLITTFHEDEELEEVFWFAKNRAHHPAHDLSTTLILHIADTPRRDELERAFKEA